MALASPTKTNYYDLGGYTAQEIEWPCIFPFLNFYGTARQNNHPNRSGYTLAMTGCADIPKQKRRRLPLTTTSPNRTVQKKITTRLDSKTVNAVLKDDGTDVGDVYCPVKSVHSSRRSVYFVFSTTIFYRYTRYIPDCLIGCVRSDRSQCKM